MFLRTGRMPSVVVSTMQAQHLQTGLRLYKYKDMQNLISVLKKISCHIPGIF